MNNFTDKNTNYDADLGEYFSTLWHGKVYIIIISILSIVLASLYLQFADRKYTVEFKLKSVSESDEKSNISGLNGLASLAGVSINSSNSNVDFEIFKELTTSFEVAEIIFNNSDNKKLIRSIFNTEWDASKNDYSEPNKGKFHAMIIDCFNILTGTYNKSYIPPNGKRLAIYISKKLKMSQDQDTGFLTIKTETSNPDMMKSLIFMVTSTSDEIMRQRYIEFSTEPLTFYKEKIRTSRSREHREALAELISVEEQRLMLASKGEFFIAEPFLGPYVSLYPTAPVPILVLTLSLIIGIFVSIIVILIRNSKAKDK
ncbi:Wzz/FepE/Etk N-terminal domain-containing protein [Amylibacter sp.]|nr:Wzz/FepE/Etk N-terminal domain-containing protein [Amylibacter sp.]